MKIPIESIYIYIYHDAKLSLIQFEINEIENFYNNSRTHEKTTIYI